MIECDQRVKDAETFLLDRNETSSSSSSSSSSPMRCDNTYVNKKTVPILIGRLETDRSDEIHTVTSSNQLLKIDGKCFIFTCEKE